MQSYHFIILLATIRKVKGQNSKSVSSHNYVCNIIPNLHVYLIYK